MAPLGTILVIEDDLATLEFIADVLSDESYTVCAVSSAVAGITALADEQPDLILLDYRLPTANGLMFARAIRSISIDVPIVLITADNHPPGELDSANIAFCLLKPFQLDELLGCIAGHMRQSKFVGCISQN